MFVRKNISISVTKARIVADFLAEYEYTIDDVTEWKVMAEGLGCCLADEVEDHPAGTQTTESCVVIPMAAMLEQYGLLGAWHIAVDGDVVVLSAQEEINEAIHA